MKNGKEMGYREKHRRYYAKVTKLYFEDGLGYLRISKLIPVAATTVKNWCITFAEENGIKMEKKVHKVQKPILKTPESTGTPNDIKALQAEVARLQKELKREKLRADAYDMMIDIAESKFNIPIRKKAGAKR
jgi:transposase-like protein